jgi:hypothetical protein
MAHILHIIQFKAPEEPMTIGLTIRSTAPFGAGFYLNFYV